VTEAIEGFPDLQVVRLARTASTQDVVRRAARAGAAEGFCCVAGEQTAGRGRQGRKWVALPGAALLVSVLLRPKASAASGVPIAAGLATIDALTACCSVRAQLKWPNDVIAGGGKLAGILAEVEPLGGEAATIAVALGLGLNLTVAEFPDGVAGVSLHRLTPTRVDRDVLLQSWLSALAGRMRVLSERGIAGLLDDWRSHAAGLGEPVTATGQQGLITGIAEDIDDTGALLVRTGVGIVRVVAGDVHLITPAATPAPSQNPSRER
jgi:BirA family transcriptional regulator, biotin operon repressor / biotin---[acetyl-CoA-carboxylase] ligase